MDHFGCYCIAVPYMNIINEVCCLLIIRVIGRNAHKHLIQQHPQQVPIDTLAMSRPFEHLRGQIGGRAAEGAGGGVVEHAFLGEAEVGEHGVAFVIEDYVVWLQVSEDNIPFMQIFKGQKEFS